MPHPRPLSERIIQNWFRQTRTSPFADHASGWMVCCSFRNRRVSCLPSTLNGLSTGGRSNISWYLMFDGTLEMYEHLGHAGSGVGRGEWHLGQWPRLVAEAVDNGLWWVARWSAARLSNVGSWWNLSDIKRSPVKDGFVIDIDSCRPNYYPPQVNVHLIPLHSFTILPLITPWEISPLRPLQSPSCLSLCNPTTSPPPRSQLVGRPIPKRRLSSPSSLVQGSNPRRNSDKTRVLRMHPALLRPRPHHRPPRLRLRQQTPQRLMSGPRWPPWSPMAPLCPDRTR